MTCALVERLPSSYATWCGWHRVSHGHCPHGHDHPNAWLVWGALAYCDHCWVRDAVMTRLEPCDC